MKEGRTTAKFDETPWSLILEAQEVRSPLADEALESLCKTYWEPVYAFIRWKGRQPHDAEDLTQEFFSRVLEKEMFRDRTAERGKFRSFLSKSLENFLANEWHKGKAFKRGGGAAHVPIDRVKAEQNFAADNRKPITPEEAYQKRWVEQLISSAVERISEEYSKKEKRACLFKHLRASLDGSSLDHTYAEIAERCDTTEAAVKSAAKRLRMRFREILLELTGDTIEDRSQAEDELRALLL